MRNSGGLYEGGCVFGNFAVGGAVRFIAGNAAGVAYCRSLKGRLHLRIEAIALEGGDIRGGILQIKLLAANSREL